MQEAENFVKDLGCSKIILGSRKGVENFYYKLGYVKRDFEFLEKEI